MYCWFVMEYEFWVMKKSVADTLSAQSSKFTNPPTISGSLSLISGNQHVQYGHCHPLGLLADALPMSLLRL